MDKINAWNHEHPIEVVGDNVVSFDTITTGNFGVSTPFELSTTSPE
jgi:hypothetical protein